MAELAVLQTTDDGYRIAVGEDTSAVFDFGTAAEFVAPDGRRFIAYVDLPEGGDESDEVESVFEYWLYEATPVDGEPEELENFDEADEVEDDDEPEPEGDQPD